VASLAPAGQFTFCTSEKILLGLQTWKKSAIKRTFYALQQAAALSNESPAKRVSLEACHKHSFMTR